MKRFVAGLALLFLAITGCSAQEASSEEIPEENFTSNSLDPGTELFANETDDTKIYAKLEEKYYLLYEQVIEEDADS